MLRNSTKKKSSKSGTTRKTAVKQPEQYHYAPTKEEAIAHQKALYEAYGPTRDFWEYMRSKETTEKAMLAENTKPGEGDVYMTGSGGGDADVPLGKTRSETKAAVAAAAGAAGEKRELRSILTMR